MDALGLDEFFEPMLAQTAQTALRKHLMADERRAFTRDEYLAAVSDSE